MEVRIIVEVEGIVDFFLRNDERLSFDGWELIENRYAVRIFIDDVSRNLAVDDFSED